ncbi:tRNA uridine-5-carboxymethylaminomethyl(34) synthesis GTPase MnmE [Alsobacter sp. KACC 23698]|uniref:tRNA modification GTPase MnmE n=1 Tax=Alsobacter sp. KACC 23698 TaxID=3149229 RepID=A0AAU7JEP9_9HYPH
MGGQILSSDTIYALATAPGRAALAVIRISGPLSGRVLMTLAGGLPPARRATVRTLRDGAGVALDEALVLFFKGPASFTGEDVAELHLHGGRAVTSAVLHALSLMEGVRPAQPGEFTRRALHNGKMDLTQAEGLADLIDSETDAQRAQAIRQYGGGLSAAVQEWRSKLLTAQAIIAADLDFSDEHDVGDDVPIGELLRLLDRVRAALLAQIADRRAERVRDGVTVVVTGPPNVGKSSLLNWFSGRDAAIVTDVPGTTRDLIEVDVDLDGVLFRFVDTAGIRETADPVESIGIDKALRRAAEADVVLRLSDRDEQPGVSVPHALPDVIQKTVRTKIDSYPEQTPWADFAISVVTGAGLTNLRGALVEIASPLAGRDPSLVTRARHRAAMTEAVSHLDRACTLLQAAGGLELVAEELRLAAGSLAELTGAMNSEAILDQVFSSFCIGK